MGSAAVASGTVSSPKEPSAQACCSSDDPSLLHLLQDTLYEYVKGLQDAIKVPDPDLAERLLEEIGSALSLPSAVSLVISANGARLIASCVKHFRWTGMQKPLKVASKLRRSSAAKVHPKSEEHDPGVVAAEERQEAAAVSSPEQGMFQETMEDLLLPSTASNESRRKRQRTAGDLDDDEDFFKELPHQNGYYVVCESAASDRHTAPSASEFSSASSKERCPSEKPRRTVKIKGRATRASKVGVSDVDAGRGKTDEAKSATDEEPQCCGKHKCGGSKSNIEAGPAASTGATAVEAEETTADDCSISSDEEDSVYIMAKASGMSSVVATACSGLDKLLNAALQVKRGTRPGLGSKRRFKPLSAEMYVALTEAFVDMVHVLKDNVDLLSWCLNCLGSICPPGSSERSMDAAAMSSIAPLFAASTKETTSEEESSKSDATSVLDVKHPPSSQAPADQPLVDQKLFSSKALIKLATKYREHTSSSDFTLKLGSKSSAGSYVAAARSLSNSKNNKAALPSTFCSGITSESSSSSISALAAVAYAATVPMLAEKAVKAVLNAMQSCDIEAHSTLAALRALSAHLSSTNTKSGCDDAFAFIIAAMREFVSDPEMQAESCLALGSLTRAVTSTTGHAAWAAISISMDHHQTNLSVQRAGCSALQVLCTRTGLGLAEWRTGKRPLRASRDADREAGARALISSMSSFPDDVRIQWHGCSTLWTLVHSAGVRTVAKMVKYGAVSAVVGAMSVCRMNEMMQQEGCNVIGTMVRTLAENGHEIGLFLAPSTDSFQTADDDELLDRRGSTNWWTALGAVVSAMKMFSKSKSLQSNGTFALGCILKGSGEAASLYATPSDLFSLPGVSAGKHREPADDGPGGATKVGSSSGEREKTLHGFSAKDIVDNVERISAAVEVTMAAMREFPKVETVQVWGCAVLQQAFLAYVHYARCLSPYARCLSPVSEARSSSNARTTNVRSDAPTTAATSSQAPSPSDSLARLILSQATSAMCMISRTMALSYNGPNGAAQGDTKAAVLPAGRSKPLTCAKSQAPSSQYFASVRQSWCAALGAIGDVFGYLTRNSEVAIGKAGFTGTDCMDFFRSNKGFFDRSSSNASLHLDHDDSSDADSDRCDSKHHSLCSGSSWMDWAGFGASQQQAVKDIKAWQEATESMAKIAENVGFPLSVKNAILSIRTIFYKLEDPETVIWACHALVSLYLTWENLHLFKPGIEVDREEYKAKIWGDGDAGVKQLVELVVHWTNQNRLDVTSLALQALYGACVFAATVQEIEKVFAVGGLGAEAVLGAMQKALSSGSAQHRRKVVQQACCVLATVCGYSIRAQVAVAAQGGTDYILTALERYNEDNQIQVNGLHALGVDSLAQSDFDGIWNAAMSRSSGGSKNGRKKRTSQGSSNSFVGLSHIFREGVNYPVPRESSSTEEGRMESCYLKGRWNPHFEKLVLDGAAQLGLFRTALLVAPGCGGPLFTVELLRRLSGKTQSISEMQAHMCFVIGYMSEYDPSWRKKYIEAGAMAAVLNCMSSIYSWKQGTFTSFTVVEADAELEVKADAGDCKNNLSDSALLVLDVRIQCAAAWAIAGLMKDQPVKTSSSSTTKCLMQAIAAALHRYGGLLSIPSYGFRSKRSHAEVCAPARLALARLGVSRISTRSEAVYLVHEAAQTGDCLCLKALADVGVDVFVVDAAGKTGEWHAEAHGQALALSFFKDQIRAQSKKSKEKPKAKVKQKKSEKQSEAAPEGVGVDAVPPKHSTSTETDGASLSGDFNTLTEAVIDPVVREPVLESSRSSKSKKKQGKVVESSTMEDSSLKEESRQLNLALHEAMASGGIEKMEAAIQACESVGSVVDERLLKTVKGALCKRLKRREKAFALEEELKAAINEGSCSRLEAAISAVEAVPRFATALQERLATAKDLLLHHKRQESDNQNKEEQQVNKDFCEVEKVLEAEIQLPDQLSIDDDDEEWISTHKGRRRNKEKEKEKEKENVDTVAQQQQNRDKKERGQQRQKKQKPPGVRQVGVPTTAQSQLPPLSNNYRCSTAGMSHPLDSFHRPPRVAAQDLPPLLPTPGSSLRTVPQTRSVIMPPKSSALATVPASEHNPITPQLFPSTWRSPLICDTDFPASEAAILAPSHAAVVPSSWSSPKSCSSLEDDSLSRLPSSRWGTSWSSRSSTPVEEYSYGMDMMNSNGISNGISNGDPWDAVSGSPGHLSALLATLVDRLPSSSTTLFSASLGEFPRTPESASTSSTGTATTTTTTTTTVLGAPSVLSPDFSDILSFLDSSWAEEGDKDWCLSSRACAAAAATGKLPHQSLFVEDNPGRMLTRSRVDAALLEASMADSCCICFDMPKDAALVPCGHRMCKGCAEAMRCVRQQCPICNRYIETVLALYG